MSIINEALQKIQQNRMNESQKLLTFLEKISYRKTLYLIVVGIMIGISVLIMILPKYLTAKKVIPNQYIALKKSHPLSNKMKIALNGVFLSDQTKIAYINNKIFQLGDAINGMKIVGINLDTITLQNSNREKIILRNGEVYSFSSTG